MIKDKSYTKSKLIDIQQRILQWFLNGDVGMSSKALASIFVDGEERFGWPPSDPSDLNRCLLLIDLVPEIKDRMNEVAKLGCGWENLVPRWGELEKCFIDEVGFGWTKKTKATKTYALMKEILQR